MIYYLKYLLMIGHYEIQLFRYRDKYPKWPFQKTSNNYQLYSFLFFTLNSIVSGHYRKKTILYALDFTNKILGKQIYSTYVIDNKYKILTSVLAYSIENIFSNLITYMYFILILLVSGYAYPEAWAGVKGNLLLLVFFFQKLRSVLDH